MTEIDSNKSINENHSLLTFSLPPDVQAPLPGQFFMVGLRQGYDPLLKRPLSTFDYSDSKVKLLYKIVGKGTKILSDMKPGEKLDILGPLGNAYPMPDLYETPLIIAGGIGIASVYYLIKKLPVKPIIIFGARKADELVMLDELRAYSQKVIVCTDDGSMGEQGTVVDILAKLQPKTANILYACGSKGMLRAVSMEALKMGLKGYVSLDEYMACGMGACLGCVTKTVEGYKRICKEGPVFKIDYIDWMNF